MYGYQMRLFVVARRNTKRPRGSSDDRGLLKILLGVENVERLASDREGCIRIASKTKKINVGRQQNRVRVFFVKGLNCVRKSLNR